MTTQMPSSAKTILPVERLLAPPNPESTTLVRVVTDSFPTDDDDGKKKLITWILNYPHPLANGAKILRMFFEDGGIEVYSSDGHMYVRTFVPERYIKFFDETMSEETFVDEVAASEEEDEPDLPEPDPAEPEPDPPAAAAPNGQPSTS